MDGVRIDLARLSAAGSSLSVPGGNGVSVIAEVPFTVP